MQKILDPAFTALVEIQKRHLWAILLLMVIITGFFGFFALRLEVDSTLDQQLSPDGDYLTLKEKMANEFGETDLFFVVVRINPESKIRPGDGAEGADVRNPKVIGAIDNLEMAIADASEVSATSSAASVFRSAFGRLPETLEETKQWAEALGPAAEGLFSRERNSSIINVQVNIPKKAGAVEEVQESVQEKIDEVALPAGVSAELTGFPTLLSRVISLMINDNIAIMAIALFFVLIALYFFFRDPILTLIGIAPVSFSVIWLGGLMAIVGMKVTVANASVAAMIIGLGVDYSIHLVNSFDEMIKRREAKPITKTMKYIGSALFISFVTTVAGFSINLFGTTEALRVQGFALAAGVTFCFINAVLLIPILLKLKIELLREEEGEHKWK